MAGCTHFAEKKVENNVCGCATGSMDVEPDF